MQAEAAETTEGSSSLMSTYQAALSPSRAKEYLQCPLKFRFSVVDRLPQPPTEATVKGTLVHAVLENLFGMPGPERTVEAAQSLVDPLWVTLQQKNPEYLSVFADGVTSAAWMEQVRDLVAQYFHLEQPQWIEPQSCESRAEVRLAGGLMLRGIIDRVDKAPSGDLRVIDYKTGKAPSQRFMGDALFQMRFYALMLRELDRLPSRMQLLYLKTADVLTLDPTEADIERFEGEVQDLWQRIATDASRGDFRPRKTPLCGWCSFQSLCPLFGGTPEQPSDGDLQRLLSMSQDTAV